jgi:phospholipid transport system substrate-binding protein
MPRSISGQSGHARARVRERALRLIGASSALIIGLALVAARPAVALADGPADPLEQTKGAVEGALRILRDKSMPLPDKRRQLRDMAEGNFDFASMSRSALGYHWKEITDDQRKDFTQVFSAFIEDAYLNRIQEYAGQDVEFVDQKNEDADRVSVESKVFGGNSDHPVPLDFMLKKDGDKWKVYDVTVDAISITANYRNQFNRVINNQGFDKLMSDLRAKQSELAESLGK